MKASFIFVVSFWALLSINKAAADIVPRVSSVQWVVPEQVAGVTTMPSNNCLSIESFEGKLFLAWRTAPDHFASTQTKMYIMSSSDQGTTWTKEHEIALGTDVREPYLVSFGGQLHFYFFQAGTDPLAFQPQFLFHTTRLGPGQWSGLEQAGAPTQVPWAYKIRNSVLYRSAYMGPHYAVTGGAANIAMSLQSTEDGVHWTDRLTYTGGISEVGFDWDNDGRLWGVGRNEDGDNTGFGAQIFWTEPNSLASWHSLAKSDPNRYDSPRMLHYNGELYLIARRDIGGPFDRGLDWLPFSARRILYWTEYSSRAKTTTLYKIIRDPANPQVVPLLDLPGDGDTAFASILPTDVPGEFLVANYTSPLTDPTLPWIKGQVTPAGTAIYFVKINLAGQ